MTPNTTEVLSRFHRALVREISEVRPDYLVEPFTVAEIYQNLVPYRSHRDVIGVEMNGDYEDALLRLLAGEGEYLFLESEVARREIREELQTGNPNTGLFRDFAAADVRLNPSKIDFEGPVLYGESEDDVSSGADPVFDPSGVSDERQETDLTDAAGLDTPEAEDDSADGEGAAGLAEVEVAGSTASPGAVPSSCPWCKGELPDREGIKFCPFCGSNLGLAPCPVCGAEIETPWRFCVACGTEAPS
ncbi:MAG: hypothetical protein BMS9Abin29_2461 [Gemmatimonadota bacterium]|nr:MAG: hypothetical protein BMS9Abin29_2461 [Gemmatimonadota bacterium]